MALQFPAQAPEDFLNLAILSVDAVAKHLNAFGTLERINGAQPLGVSQFTQNVNGDPLFYGRVSIPLERDHAETPAWDAIDYTKFPSRTLYTAYSSALAAFDDSNKHCRLAVYSLLGIAAHYKARVEEGSAIGQRFNVETDITQDANGDPVFVGSCAVKCTSDAASGSEVWLYPDPASVAAELVYSNTLASFAGASA